MILSYQFKKITHLERSHVDNDQVFTEGRAVVCPFCHTRFSALVRVAPNDCIVSSAVECPNCGKQFDAAAPALALLAQCEKANE